MHSTLDKNSTVYGIVDGDTLEIRYVGKTHFSLEERMKGHRVSKENVPLADWIVLHHGTAIVLERVAPAHLDRAERRWLRRLLGEGARLLNVNKMPRLHLGERRGRWYRRRARYI